MLDPNLESSNRASQPVAPAQPGPLPPAEDFARKFEEHLPDIRKAAVHACRRYGLSPEDVEDFTQDVKVKVMSDGYAVLRKFRGTSSLGFYLAAVVQKALQDWTEKRWGKWRLSAQAIRLGPHAARLETLMVKDRHPYREACQIILTEDQEVTQEELDGIYEQLPTRVSRRRDVSLDTEAAVGRRTADAARGSSAWAPADAVSKERADDRVVADEWRRCTERIWKAFSAALAGLDPEDLLIARAMAEGVKPVNIARRLSLSEKQIYPRSKRILEKLRRSMEAAGITREEVASILGDDHE